jgi:type II secretory pathway pseudopilin PulG
MKRSAEAGFSLAETLVACAIVLVAGMVALASFVVVSRGVMRSSASAQSGQASLDSVAASLRADAATAFAVFVPPTDVFGGPTDGRELDFYAKDDRGNEIFWAYRYDPTAHVLQRFDYVSIDATGRHVPPLRSAPYPPLAGVTNFAAAIREANELSTPANGDYAPAVTLGFNTHGDPVNFQHPYVTGGNRIVDVRVATATATLHLHLGAGIMPSGFTVIGKPVYHAIIYRHDSTSRSWLGFAQKSHVWIDGVVEVSYDGYRTHPKLWCQYNIYGGANGQDGGAHGLDGDDPHANYIPTDPAERAQTLLWNCGHLYGGPTPPPPSAPGVHFTPVPQPILMDSPPPCWNRQPRCWPPNAPPTWAPSPMPSDTPPPRWCATHPESPACAPPMSSPAPTQT